MASPSGRNDESTTCTQKHPVALQGCAQHAQCPHNARQQLQSGRQQLSMGDNGALALMCAYGSDSEDEGQGREGGAPKSREAGEASESDEGVDILGAITAATENAGDGRSPLQNQNPDDEGTTAEAAAEEEALDEAMLEAEPIPRRQCVSIPARFMEGIEIPGPPEGEVAPETLVRLTEL